MRRAWAHFRQFNHFVSERVFRPNPVLANSIFYGILYASSDLSQQVFVTPIVTGQLFQNWDLPDRVKVVDIAPAEPHPVESSASGKVDPIGSARGESGPVKNVPVESPSSEVKSEENIPVEITPLDSAPDEADPIGATPGETAPVEAISAEAAIIEDEKSFPTLSEYADAGKQESYVERAMETADLLRPYVNYHSVFRAWIMGTFVIGPSVSLFVKHAHMLIPGKSVTSAIKKVALDQCIMAAPMISLFYFCMNMLEGNSFQDFQEEWHEKFFKTWRSALCFWPWVQMVSWTKVPHIWRPRFLACCSFFWANFLCYMKDKPTAPSKENALVP